jgi:hypothetical protein
LRILVVTDAWRPQVNGVVRTLERLAETLGHQGVGMEFLSPEGFPTLPLPSYPDIRLALATARQVAARIDAAAPASIHIASRLPNSSPPKPRNMRDQTADSVAHRALAVYRDLERSTA